MAQSPTTKPGSETPRANGGRDKRQQVIDAAVEQFLSHGFDQTSMDGIAAHAGVSKTTVYAHYADKLALFRAAVQRSAQSLAVELDEDGVSAAEPPEARLTHVLLSILEATTQPEFRAFLRVMVTESARHPDLAEAMRAAGTVDPLASITEALVDEAASRGYRIEDARGHAVQLLRMTVSGPQLDSLLFATFRPDRGLLQAHARWVVDIFLRGIEPRGDGDVVSAPTGSAHYPWFPDAGEPATDT